jgi:signal peptidase
MDGLIRYAQAMVMVVGLLIALAVASIVVLPRIAGWSTLVVLSGSMEPAMPVGGLAFVRPTSAADVRPGDVVTFPRPDDPEALVSHRVIAVTQHLGEPTLWTKGDANEAADAWAVPADAAIGEVQFTVPYLGRLSRYMQTRQGYLSVLAIPALLVVVVESLNIGRAVWTARTKRHATT